MPYALNAILSFNTNTFLTKSFTSVNTWKVIFNVVWVKKIFVFLIMIWFCFLKVEYLREKCFTLNEENNKLLKLIAEKDNRNNTTTKKLFNTKKQLFQVQINSKLKKSMHYLNLVSLRKQIYIF